MWRFFPQVGARFPATAGGSTWKERTTTDKCRLLALIDFVLSNRVDSGRRQLPWERADSQTDCLTAARRWEAAVIATAPCCENYRNRCREFTLPFSARTASQLARLTSPDCRGIEITGSFRRRRSMLLSLRFCDLCAAIEAWQHEGIWTSCQMNRLLYGRRKLERRGPQTNSGPKEGRPLEICEGFGSLARFKNGCFGVTRASGIGPRFWGGICGFDNGFECGDERARSDSLRLKRT